MQNFGRNKLRLSDCNVQREERQCRVAQVRSDLSKSPSRGNCGLLDDARRYQVHH